MNIQSGPRGVLLDIEGTTSSISFVHSVMFPFAAAQLDTFLATRFDDPSVRSACEQIARDAGYPTLSAWADELSQTESVDLVRDEVRRLMACDAKTTGLKALQGLIWEEGFRSGELQAHVYDDVVPAITAWRESGVDVRIYSSGSVGAQKLFFGHVEGLGDCLHLFSGHYDTTIGGKKEPESYTRIARDWELDPARILFVSDVAEELAAAQTAGLRVLASVRPGNGPLPADCTFDRIHSFSEIRVD